MKKVSTVNFSTNYQPTTCEYTWEQSQKTRANDVAAIATASSCSRSEKLEGHLRSKTHKPKEANVAEERQTKKSSCETLL